LRFCDGFSDAKTFRDLRGTGPRREAEAPWEGKGAGEKDGERGRNRETVCIVEQ